MASLSCLSIFEAGAFGSSPGNVIIPEDDNQFPPEVLVYALIFVLSRNTVFYAMGL